MGEQLKAVELPKRTLSKLPKRTLRSIESSCITETHYPNPQLFIIPKAVARGTDPYP